MISALLDADVLVNAAVRDTLLRAAERELYRLALSTEILTEAQHALEGNLGRSREQTDYLVGEIRKSFEECLVEGYEGLIPSLQNDEKDRHVLAAAIRASVEIIVTWNLKDFPEPACSPYHIQAQHPDQFLLGLWTGDSEIMAMILQEQASDLEGWTAQRLVTRLARHVPAFAGAVVASGLV